MDRKKFKNTSQIKFKSQNIMSNEKKVHSWKKKRKKEKKNVHVYDSSIFRKCLFLFFLFLMQRAWSAWLETVSFSFLHFLIPKNVCFQFSFLFKAMIFIYINIAVFSINSCVKYTGLYLRFPIFFYNYLNSIGRDS